MLRQLGRGVEATYHYRQALTAELAQGSSDEAPSVKVARYFLADQLTHQGEPAVALEVLGPSLNALPNDWLLATAQALAFFALGRLVDARSAAERALLNASSDAKRTELAEHLHAVLATNNT